MKADITNAIRNYALQNAVKYEGKANPGNIVGKVIGQFPEIKREKNGMAELMKKINKTVQEVNRLGVEKQTVELMKNAPELLEKKEEKKGLKDLNNAEHGKVVMRFEPSPSGPMHLGHSYPLMLNYEYCKKYDGKLILRISDTNSDNIYPPAYELLQQDFRWLCKDIKNEVFVQSDRMEKYYECVLELLKKHHAYVCECPSEKFSDYVKSKTPCPCRGLSAEKNLKRWKKMLDAEKGYREGDCAVRLKTDMAHKNPAMRDFPLARINETPHPRQGTKYRVWPLMNLAVAVDDHDMGMTHVLRGKDHYDNTKRQEYIFNYLGWKKPEYIHIGRINFAGLRLSTTETRKAIEKKEYDSWEDVRIPFLLALRRRGYQPDAFRKYALSVGVTMVDKKVPSSEFFKSINTFNKEVIDSTAWRLFFIKDPVKIEVENAPSLDVELDLHPQNKKGGRKLVSGKEFYIAKEDYDLIKENEIVRLMDCINFVRKGERFLFDSTDYEKYKEHGKLIIHWLPAEHKNIKAEILMDDGSVVKGICEEKTKELVIGDILQFERTGFCRLDNKQRDKYVFCFGHR